MADGFDAGMVVHSCRSAFDAGKTRSYEARITHLHNLKRMITENKQAFVDALYKDLRKPEFEAVTFEVDFCHNDCVLAINELKQWMKPEKQTVRGKLTTAMKVSDAIAHIHVKGFTHSDIKPDNILIRKSDNEPFVCDLGLGHGVTRSKFTSPGMRDVIPKWAPPESFDPGYMATYEGDVWSLACVLLELFTGYRLWENIARVGNEHVQELAINQIVKRFLRGNFTPDILSLVDIAAVRDALQSCFTENKQKRPSAKDLSEIFEGALSSVNE